ncbi:SepM family pheromone-processing serine protease [Bacillus tuaregi]|uniref:SepM family pheromone-processing serine protease n=1 Tax=Bacillus tuaregi TaxID=1816695 RepID=UPI0008F90A82|nr:SepM family pheromone-processing serine protease [Bacillus tuaregi]
MKKTNIIRILLIIAFLFLVSSFYYLPYYVSKPGMAKELEPIIEVKDGYDEKGSFMLTTVRMGRANIYSYITAKFMDYVEVYPMDDIRAENETDEEYNIRQLHLMDSSKAAAIEVAYKKAGIPIDYHYKGVYVLHVVPDMPADGKLKAADRIFKVDDLEFSSSEEFITYVSRLEAGEQVTLTYERNNKINEVSLMVEAFKDNENKERVGIGIGLVDDKELLVDPAVHMKTDEIGGPSAGFMFSLEIYNQLTKLDLTKGYEIAGTGTISPDGTVGKIGGIEQKVIAADKAGADIFLAPNEAGSKSSNYLVAVQTAKNIGTDMKIIPVDTFDEAVSYLEKLSPKK